MLRSSDTDLLGGHSSPPGGADGEVTDRRERNGKVGHIDIVGCFNWCIPAGSLSKRSPSCLVKALLALMLNPSVLQTVPHIAELWNLISAGTCASFLAMTIKLVAPLRTKSIQMEAWGRQKASKARSRAQGTSLPAEGMLSRH